MTMTVKRLIAELEKIENKYLEVKVMTLEYKLQDVDHVNQSNKKFLILKTK